jgi:alkylhydroperoxidase/carboxymuconolactone decarboxylase family protein YurZ
MARVDALISSVWSPQAQPVVARWNDAKTRSVMNFAMLTTLNRAPEIKLHAKGALNNRL